MPLLAEVMSINIIGAGLAGSEAAWQAAEAGCEVILHEMRPEKLTPAHLTGACAELVCSNSLRGADLANAVGLLKEELRRCNSLVMQAADLFYVPAGGALAVDRGKFSAYIDNKIRTHNRIKIVLHEICEILPFTGNNPLIIASGPLTSAALASALLELTGSKHLSFYDAISPIITVDSIDQTRVFKQSRYGKGTGDEYLNIPMERDEYYDFVAALQQADKHTAHLKDEQLRPFEGCMPIEDMAERGADTLRYGPLKPVGLCDPNTGCRPFAVVQLRRDNCEGTLWSMVGMQTRMKHGEQLRIFRTLAGLAQAEFVRLGTVHRNTFIDSPGCLDATLKFRDREGLFAAGQLTGTEGYVESTAGGLVAGINAARMARGEALLKFPLETAIGSLLAYISEPTRKEFQPMNISFGLISDYMSGQDHKGTKLGKRQRRLKTAERALLVLSDFLTLTRGVSQTALKVS